MQYADGGRRVQGAEARSLGGGGCRDGVGGCTQEPEAAGLAQSGTALPESKRPYQHSWHRV